MLSNPLDISRPDPKPAAAPRAPARTAAPARDDRPAFVVREAPDELPAAKPVPRASSKDDAGRPDRTKRDDGRGTSTPTDHASSGAIGSGPPSTSARQDAAAASEDMAAPAPAPPTDGAADEAKPAPTDAPVVPKRGDQATRPGGGGKLTLKATEAPATDAPVPADGLAPATVTAPGAVATNEPVDHGTAAGELGPRPETPPRAADAAPPAAIVAAGTASAIADQPAETHAEAASPLDAPSSSDDLDEPLEAGAASEESAGTPSADAAATQAASPPPVPPPPSPPPAAPAPTPAIVVESGTEPAQSRAATRAIGPGAAKAASPASRYAATPAAGGAAEPKTGMEPAQVGRAESAGVAATRLKAGAKAEAAPAAAAGPIDFAAHLAEAAQPLNPAGPSGAFATSVPLAAPTAVANPPASAPAPSAAMTVPVGAVPVEIGLRALDGSSRFEIRLSPEDLGRIDVKLDIDAQGQVKAHLIVDRPETLAFLQRDGDSLHRAFEQAGFKPAENGVAFSLRDPGADAGGNRGGSGENGQPRGQQPPWARQEREAAPDVPPTAWRTLRAGPAGIDRQI